MAGHQFVPEQSALVVVDMQNAFLDPAVRFRYAPAALDIVGPINALARWFRDAGSRVVWVRTTSRSDPADWPSLRRLLGEEAMDFRTAVLAEGAPGQAMWPGMEVAPQDRVVRKYRYSAMVEPGGELQTVLEEDSTRMLYVAGTQTNICCESTARDAMMLGHDAVLVSDCLAAETPELHEASLASYASAFGGVVSSAEVTGG